MKKNPYLARGALAGIASIFWLMQNPSQGSIPPGSTARVEPNRPSYTTQHNTNQHNTTQPINPQPAYCGNAVIEENEQCDDGNNDNQDQCAECQVNSCSINATVQDDSSAISRAYQGSSPDSYLIITSDNTKQQYMYRNPVSPHKVNNLTEESYTSTFYPNGPNGISCKTSFSVHHEVAPSLIPQPNQINNNQNSTQPPSQVPVDDSTQQTSPNVNTTCLGISLMGENSASNVGNIYTIKQGNYIISCKGQATAHRNVRSLPNSFWEGRKNNYSEYNFSIPNQNSVIVCDIDVPTGTPSDPSGIGSPAGASPSCPYIIKVTR